MEKNIDLHIHSYISDGSIAPKDIVDLAIKNNIRAIALTDHDSIEGIEELSKYAKKLELDFLTGIEISCKYKDNKIIHILGLGIDVNNPNFINPYKEMKLARENGLDEVIKYITDKGINISKEDLQNLSTNKYIDRYTIYRYFIENNICSNPQEIWNKYLDKVPYGKGELINVEDAIDMIIKSGGVAMLAHYNKEIGFKGYTKEEIEENIKYLVKKGLSGVELYYPSFKREDYEFLNYIIDKYDLIYSGGTDFHGKNRKDINLGIGNGDFYVPFSIYEMIINKI